MREISVDDYQFFVEKIKQKTGIDLSLYKEGQMKRRLETIKNKRGHHSFSDYFYEINANKEVLMEFLDKMTINVSEFYRNAKRWEVLEKKILPKLLKGNGKLKVWSAACSTGEEPYTLAMVLSKYFPLSQISILATDIDKTAIERAKIGIYPGRSLHEVPGDMISKHFTKDGNMYKISDEIKRTVMFKQQNLLKDNFDKDYDLIICRNVMIYFTEEAKDILYQKFSSSLKRDGVLFVGSTEQIFNPINYHFNNEETFFYRKV